MDESNFDAANDKSGRGQVVDEPVAADRDARSIAWYVAGRCLDAGDPIGNVRLNAMLYLIDRDYEAEKGKRLFHEEFRTGDILLQLDSVLFEFSIFGCGPIFDTEFVNLHPDIDRSLLDSLIDRYAAVPFPDVVDRAYASWKNLLEPKAPSPEISDVIESSSPSAETLLHLSSVSAQPEGFRYSGEP